MIHRLLAVAIVSAGMSGAAHAAGGAVNVNFIEPEKFTDAGSDKLDRDTTLRALQAHLQKLGERYLASDQTLDVTITDIDLAGTMRPLRRTAGEVRIVRGGTDFPRITLRYALQGPGQAEQRGSETLADLGYQQHITGYSGTEPLRYEKHMLDQWFKERFARALP